jgi:hypothetical protein
MSDQNVNSLLSSFFALGVLNYVGPPSHEPHLKINSDEIASCREHGESDTQLFSGRPECSSLMAMARLSRRLVLHPWTMGTVLGVYLLASNNFQKLFSCPLSCEKLNALNYRMTISSL